MSARIAYQAALVLFVLGLFGCSRRDMQSRLATQPEEATAKRQQFDGFSFEIPNGWSYVAPDRPKTKAMVLLGGDRWDQANGMIKVDVGVPLLGDLKATAEGLAKNFGGTVMAASIDIDGENGVQVQAPPGGLTMSPRRGIVVLRAGNVYLIMAGAVGDTDISSAMEHVSATWKWRI